MRVAIITPTFSKFSGIDRFIEQKIKKLSKNNKITVIAFKGDIKVKDVDVVYVGAPKSPFLERMYRLFFFLDIIKIIKILNKIKKYDVVECHIYPTTIIGFLAKLLYKKKYVYYNEGIADPELFQNFFERMYLRLFILFNNITIKNTDYAFSISKFLSNELKRQTGIPSKVEYVEIDRSRFNKKVNKNIKKINKIKKRYNVKGPLLIYVGRISPHKGIHLLIKSFNIVNKSFPKAKLLIIGKHTFSSYTKSLKRLIKNKKNIIFTGFVSDQELPFYYAASDLYVTATLWEGFDMPIKEAQALGKRVVAFDIGPHKEITRKGILVEKGNIREFAHAIIKLLKSKK